MSAHIKALLVVLIFIFIGFVGYTTFFKSSESEVPVVHANAKSDVITLPQQELTLVDGKKLSLQSFKNKIVIMNFWASWCAPCIEEVPSLLELTKKNKDILVLAVSGDSKTEDLMAFMKSFPGFNKSPFYQVWDNNQEILKNYNIVKLPESFIFNRKGEMVKRVSGTLNWNTPDSLEFFKSLD